LLQNKVSQILQEAAREEKKRREGCCKNRKLNRPRLTPNQVESVGLMPEGKGLQISPRKDTLAVSGRIISYFGKARDADSIWRCRKLGHSNIQGDRRYAHPCGGVRMVNSPIGSKVMEN